MLPFFVLMNEEVLLFLRNWRRIYDTTRLTPRIFVLLSEIVEWEMIEWLKLCLDLFLFLLQRLYDQET